MSAPLAEEINELDAKGIDEKGREKASGVPEFRSLGVSAVGEHDRAAEAI
jgi:hypothetical protein